MKPNDLRRNEVIVEIHYGGHFQVNVTQNNGMITEERYGRYNANLFGQGSPWTITVHAKKLENEFGHLIMYIQIWKAIFLKMPQQINVSVRHTYTWR